MMKRWIAVMLSVVLAVSLVACGNKKNDGEKVVAAMEKMSTAQSYHSTMKTEVQMEMPEVGTMEVSVDMDMSCVMDPMKAKIDMKINVLGEGMDMSMYMQEKDGNYEVYVLDGGEWLSTEMSMEEIGQMDAKASLQMYVESSKSFSFAGTEEINGYQADRYDGAIEGEALQKAMSNMGNTPGVNLKDTGLDEEVLKKLGKLPLSVWIDQESGYPVYYSMDMSDIMTKMMEQIVEGMGLEGMEVKVEKMEITMSFTDFDAVPDFEMPVGNDLAAA